MFATVAIAGLLSAIAILGAVIWLSVSTASVPSALPTSSLSPRPLAYREVPLERGIAHVLLVPAEGEYVVTPAIAPGLVTVAEFAEDTGAIAVLNGGFFDPNNQQTTSFVIRAGEVIADPAQNSRLTENPDLKPYLDAILNRSEWRRYECDGDRRYDIAFRSDPVPPNCTLLDALGGGPQLVPEQTDEAEAFVAYRDGQTIRDALGRDRPNARTAIGITNSGDLLWVVAAQTPEFAPQSGALLSELATLMQNLGAVRALNLDGGSSAGMTYDHTLYLGKLDGQGEAIERPIKSVLLLQRESD